MRKETVEEKRALSIFRLNKWGYLNSPQTGTITWTARFAENSISIRSRFLNERPSEITLDYNALTEPKTERSYSVRITRTPCYLGGYRYWFICPLVKNGIPCNKRVAKLYYGSTWFGCRHCLELAYESQYEYWGVRTRAFADLASTWRLEEKIQDLRVKFWKGRPTKRYQKLLYRIRSKNPLTLADLNNLLSK